MHNPDNLQVSNAEDLSTGVDAMNSVEHNVYMEGMAENQEAVENQEAGVQVLFFLPTYI